MTKIRVFVLTYQCHQLFNQTLKHLFTSDLMDHDHEVFVMNNHTDIRVDPIYKPLVKIIDNQARPDFSTGHSARSWNECIMHGFESLKKHADEYVVFVQNDMHFYPNWVENLMQIHEENDFTTCGVGDELHSHTVASVKKIGLFDERYCVLGFQEADYQLRAAIHHGDRSSINDHQHKRVWNPHPLGRKVVNNNNTTTGLHRADPLHMVSRNWRHLVAGLWKAKWGKFPARDWDQYLGVWPTQSMIPGYIYYPYFEEDIDYESQGYFLPKRK